MPVTKYQDLPIDDQAETRSKGEAIRSALGSDLSLDDAEGRSRVKKIMAWSSGDGRSQDDYKLPIGAYLDGEPRAIWGNITAAVASVNGARGGPDLSQAEKRSVFNHLMKYYAKKDIEPDDRPVFRGSAYADGDGPLTLARVAIGSEPPDEFRILKAGRNPARKGRAELEIVFDAKARAAMSESIRPDRALPFDVGHRQLNGGFGSPADDEAVGWFQPEMRGNELWATDVEFTEEMAEKIRARKFRFFSPAFDIELSETGGKETIRPVGLVNMALTNIPALRDIAPLVADQREADAPQEGGDVPSPPPERKGVTVTLTGLAAYQALAERAKVLVARMLELEGLEAARVKRHQAAAVEEQIQRLHAEGRLPLSLHDWARSRTLEQTAEWAAHAPSPAEAAAPPAKFDATEVTPEMREVAKQMDVPIEDIAAHLERQSKGSN